MAAESVDTGFAFDNTYARLPDTFYQRVEPSAVTQPSLLAVNQALAETLGIDAGYLHSAQALQVLSGNALAKGSEPLAMAYAGHQFGHFVPQLGDGRAILLGEVLGTDGERYDVQLKGAGRTAWSRGGDGRNWIGPVMREYLLSEAMAAMQIPTTRALAAVRTGEPVLRETGPMPGAIITRIARSHLRVGTFQYFTARQDIEAVRTLLAYVIDRHYTQAGEQACPAIAVLNAVINRQATLVAHWQSVGFIHGVMNTDNCSITGDTIDYGPCAFMDTFENNKVFSSIDHQARYAYSNQPRIAQWNLVNLAQCLLPLIDDDVDAAVAQAQAAIDSFDEQFVSAYRSRMGLKIGLASTQADDLPLIQTLLETMEQQKLDFTQVFSQLTQRMQSEATGATGGLTQDPFNAGPLATWFEQLRQRHMSADIEPAEAARLMATSNPWVIPRNHQVESVIQAAIQGDDEPFHDLLAAVTRPFDDTLANSPYTKAPTETELVTQTFCGT